MTSTMSTTQRQEWAAGQLDFYKRHLQSSLLPFWLGRAVDAEYGGFYTCFDIEGQRLLSQDKFTWSQGRIVWIWAKLAGMGMFTPAERQRFLGLARAGATFLMKHCLLPNGNCAFLMSRDGTPKAQAPGMPLDSSVYADCFVILGLSRFAAMSADTAAIDFALRLYSSVAQRVQSGTFRSEPYPVPAGYRPHGIPMILLNTVQELAAGLEALGRAEAAALRGAAEGYLHDIMSHFVDPDASVHEFITSGGDFDHESLLGRHVNPGHTIEDMWFVMHQARQSKDSASATATIAKASDIIKRAFLIGWDEEYGGLLHFADHDGGPPRGETAAMEDVKVVQQVLDGWGDKLWWVHSEALDSTLLAYYLTGDASLLALYQRVYDYTFATFPNPDPTVGEWIQIRDRQGQPQQKVVALPVKDPFHIMRNIALIIDLFSEPASET
jgi:N-acylglucosamine 2-epimerase